MLFLLYRILCEYIDGIYFFFFFFGYGKPSTYWRLLTGACLVKCFQIYKSQMMFTVSKSCVMVRWCLQYQNHVLWSDDVYSIKIMCHGQMMFTVSKSCVMVRWCLQYQNHVSWRDNMLTVSKSCVLMKRDVMICLVCQNHMSWWLWYLMCQSCVMICLRTVSKSCVLTEWCVSCVNTVIVTISMS